MKFLRILQMAFSAMRLNKTRTFLSTLGVVIGVASLILITSFGYGAQASILSRIQSMGANTLIVTPGTTTNMQREVAGQNAIRKPLTYEDLKYLEDQVPGLQASPQTQTRTTVTIGSNEINTTVVGTNENFLTVYNYTLATGRTFTLSDIAGYRNYCILGATIANELFGNESPIGQSVNVLNSKFYVIGVLKEVGAVGFSNVDMNIFIPITKFQAITGQNNLQGIYIITPPDISMDELTAIITKLLTIRHGMTNFTITNMAQFIELATTTTNTLTTALTIIGLISLVVGGIGIMNIMLASVAERTREIGVRKAIGATQSDILLQFLAEAITVTVMGGTIGIIVGVVGARLANSISRTAITPTSIIIGFSVSVAVGVFFGVYPAMKASRLNPVEALRYE
jgi:putative ABC transport system permease protein